MRTFSRVGLCIATEERPDGKGLAENEPKSQVLVGLKKAGTKSLCIP
jgi:hypothetical protein